MIGEFVMKPGVMIQLVNVYSHPCIFTSLRAGINFKSLLQVSITTGSLPVVMVFTNSIQKQLVVVSFG